MTGAREQDERRKNFRVGLVVLASVASILVGGGLWSMTRVDGARSECLDSMHRGITDSSSAQLERSAECFEGLARARPVRAARNLFRAEVARTLLEESEADEISRWPRETKPGIDALARGEYARAADEFAAASASGGSSAGVARRFERLSRDLAENHSNG